MFSKAKLWFKFEGANSTNYWKLRAEPYKIRKALIEQIHDERLVVGARF